MDNLLNSNQAVWYCGRTKPKREHIAAANVRKTLGLEVFLPRFRFERATLRGIVRVIEPVFPCYIFIHSTRGACLDELRYISGIHSLVHFGGAIPTIPEATIAELKNCFSDEEPLSVQDDIQPGSEVRVATGAFAHLTGIVLRFLPARKRVQILLEILGRNAAVELDQKSVVREKISLVSLIPALAV